MNFITKFGRLVARTFPIKSKGRGTFAEEIGFPKFGGDFRVDLKQDIDIYDMFMHYYMKPTDQVRVRMPSRFNELQPNMKYVPYIQQIIISKLKERNSVSSFIDKIKEFKDEDISTASVKENYSVISNALHELAFNIYIKEHRLRYQQEQQNRFQMSEKCFKSAWYLNRGKTVEQFIVDYNNFIWTGINASHQGMSPKIENNYRRNYHDGEVSPVTSLVFFLYFKTNGWSRFFSRLLLSTYRNPNQSFQKKMV